MGAQNRKQSLHRSDAQRTGYFAPLIAPSTFAAILVMVKPTAFLGRACVLRLERTGRDLGPITYLVQLVAGGYKKVRDANPAQAGTVARLGVVLHQIRGDHILAGLLLGLGEGLIRKGRPQRNGSKRRLLLLVERLD